MESPTRHLIVVEVAGFVLGLEAERARSVFSLHDEPGANPAPSNARDEGGPLPLVDLGERLGLPAVGARSMAVAVDTVGGPVALRVDRVLDVTQVPETAVLPLPPLVRAAGAPASVRTAAWLDGCLLILVNPL